MDRSTYDSLVSHGLDISDELLPLMADWSEGSPPDQDAVGQAFRALHTVKGAFCLMGITTVSDLAHAMEDLVGDLRDLVFNPTEEMLRLLSAGAEELKRLIEDEWHEASVQTQELILALQRLHSGEVDVGDPFDDVVVERCCPLAPTVDEARRAWRRGHHIYRLRFQDHRDVGARGRTFLDVDDLLLTLGDPLAVELDVRLVGGLGDCLQRALEVEVLLETEVSVAECAELLELSSESIESLDLRQSVPSHFRTLFIMRDAPGEHEASGRHQAVPAGSGLKALLQGIGSVAEDLALRVGKQIRVAIQTIDHPVAERHRQLLQGALIHLVRNAIDHGVEGVEERAAMGKAPTACVGLDGRIEDGKLRLVVRDNGRGVDCAAVLARARERGLRAAAGIRPGDAAAIHALLLEPGFSTRDSIGELSGRGVGLDVVRDAVCGLGGEIVIDSELGKGSTMTLLLPADAVAD